MKDQRTATRYDLSLPIIVRAPTGKRAASRIGETRDVSSRGVYFTIDNRLRAGAELELTVGLPNGASLRATGKVVRVDKRSRNCGQKVAAVFEMCQVVRDKDTIA